MDGSNTPPALPLQQVSLQTLVATIQQGIQAQNLIATNIAKLTTAFSNAYPVPLVGSAAWTPGAISNNASVTKTVTVTGAALGNYVKAAFSLTIAGLSISAYVSAANTVTVVLTNDTGGTVTLGAGTINVSVTVV